MEIRDLWETITKGKSYPEKKFLCKIMLKQLNKFAENAEALILEKVPEMFTKYFEYRGKVRRLMKLKRLLPILWAKESIEINIMSYKYDTIRTLEEIHKCLFYASSLFKDDMEIRIEVEKLDELLTLALTYRETFFKYEDRVEELKLQLIRFSELLSLKISDYIEVVLEA